jgi:hypothetical protein
MALASKQVTYTPFNKTSWGFASTDLSGTHSGLTNVKVTINLTNLPVGTVNQWDETGHISTTGSGSAVASYNKQQFLWSCSGPLADVDAVLVALNLFPADFPSIRGWDATKTKPNQTTGNYTNENPGDTYPIPNTLFDLKVYDADNVAGGSTDYVITFAATQPTFGKQRPYWSTVPSDEDANTSAHGAVAGGLLDLGEISQLNTTTNVSDTDPLTVTCEFRHYNPNPAGYYPGSAYGQITPSGNIFTGDKKPGATDNIEARMNFTGTKAEVQSYLDNVRYYNMGNETTFDMVFKISNGVVGSEVKKSIWFSDATIGATTVSAQSFIEDTAATWDFGAITTSNIQPDVDVFGATVTLDSTGISGADTLTTSTAGVTQAFNGTTGVLTISHTSEATLLTALRNLTFTPNDDFNSNFNMTFQLTYTGSAISSSYTSATQTVAVSGTATEDISNHTTSHTYVEDNTYHFSAGDIPQIIHYANHNFTVTFTMGITVGRLGVSGSAATFTNVGNGVFTLSGTRDNVNADLLTLYYAPAADYNETHTITFTSDRTSGTGHASSSSIHTGSFTMTGTAVGEYSITQLVDVAWEEDVTKAFDSGLQITDTADETVDSPAFESHYIIACEMYNNSANGGGLYTDGTLRVASASQGSLTISATTGQGGNGLFGGDALTISGTKTEVNTAMQNLEFVPDPNFDGAGPDVWYYIKRVSDNTYLTTLGPTQPNGSQYSYPNEVVTTFLDASATADYSISINTYDWEENVTKVFDSGLQITDKVTENPAYNTSPNDFYNTTYTVDVVMYVNSGGTEYSNATLDTGTKGSLTISGTGQSEADKFIMTGSRADLNAALTTMKFIPDIDNVETTNQTTLWYRIKRNYDYNASTGVGLLHDQGLDVKTVFNANAATTNYQITVPSNIPWNEDQSKSFNSGVVITDKATENSDHASYFNTTFEIEARAKHYKVLTAGAFVVGLPSTIVSVGDTDFTAIGASANTVGVSFTPTGVGSGTGTVTASQPMNDAVWNCTNNGGATVTGIGTDASRLNITGTKAQVNIAVANMKMIPNLDMTTPTDNLPSSAGFWFEYKITRKHDSLIYNHYASGSTNFNLGTAIAPYFATVSNMAYNEDTTTTIFAGKDVGITETATADPLYSGNAVTYQVEVEISPNADGQWGTTGSSTYVTAVGNAEDVNAELKALVFTPTLDSSNNPSILYKQTRYRSGDADLVQADGTVNIGTVTGTAVTPYVTSVTPAMTFLENTPFSPFSGKTIGITEDVSHYTPDATYKVELKISPTSDAEWDFESWKQTDVTPPVGIYSGAKTWILATRHITFTGSKEWVNWIIERQRIIPLADNEIDFNILYSQTRYIPGSADVDQADEVNIGTATGTNFPEFIYGTSNNNTQYWVIPDNVNGVNTSASVADIISGGANVVLTPRQLATNLGEPYERPITITDATVGAQFKIVFTPGTFNLQNSELNIMDTGFQTKADLHSIIEDGIYVNTKVRFGEEPPSDALRPFFEGRTDLNIPNHETTQTFNFIIYKRTYVGSETQIANGQLNYKFLTSPTLWHVDTTWNSLMELTSINETQYIYSDVPVLNVVKNLPDVTVSKNNKRFWFALSDRLLYKTLTGRWDSTTMPHVSNNSLAASPIHLILGIGHQSSQQARLSGTEAGAIQHYISGRYSQYQAISDFNFYRQDFRGILSPGTYGPSGFPVSSYMDVVEKGYGPLIQPAATASDPELKVTPINLIAYTDWGVMVVHHNINLNLID